MRVRVRVRVRVTLTLTLAWSFAKEPRGSSMVCTSSSVPGQVEGEG